MEATVRFKGWTPSPRAVVVGMERDNKVFTLRFEGFPAYPGGTAYLHIDFGSAGADSIEIVNGLAEITRNITQHEGEKTAYVEIIANNDVVWHSDLMFIYVNPLPMVDKKIEQAYPTAFEQALAQTAADKAAAAKSAAAAAAAAEGIVTEEAARKDAEGKRVKAETARETAEANREQAEEAREQDTAAAVKRADDLVKSVEAKLENGDFIGAQGPQGPIGATGPQGVQGVQGEKGEKGEKGDTGATGPQGVPGANGADGAPGKDGLDAPQIDDTTVSDAAPWSSQHIVDVLCPPLEESGNPVVCYPVAGSKLGVMASWEPTQEGSGEPYPAGGGPNLLDISQCAAIVGKPYGVTVTIDGDIIKVSGVPSSEVTEESNYSFAVASCAQTELRGKGYKVTPFALKGNVSSAWGLRTENEDSLAISAKLTPGVNTDIQLRLMVSKNTPTAYSPYANIRPIHGRTEISVERCGENLLNIAPFTKLTKSGVTYEYVANGGVHISGTATDNVDSPTFAVGHLPPGKYYGLDMGTGVAASIVVQRKGSNGYLWLNAKGVFEILAGDTIKYWYMIANNGVTLDKTVYPYIVPGTSAPAEYVPYAGETKALALPKEIYGGEVGADGAGQETWKLLTLTGEEQSHIFQNLFYLDIGALGGHSFVAGICSHYKYTTYANDSIGVTIGDDDGAVVYNPNGAYEISKAGLAAWKSYLAAQYAAGTPVQIAYKLATPIPFAATGGGAIKALSGTNTVLTDANALTVTGRADPIHIIKQLQAASAASAQALADVERAVTDI